jgi:hypothetical protein
MSFNYSRIIPQPLRNFVKRYASARQETRECVPHGVWRDPPEAALFRVFLERSREIVTITVFPVLDRGLKHKRFSHCIDLKELKEGSCKRYCAFFPVFEIDRGRLSQMQQPGP